MVIINAESHLLSDLLHDQSYTTDLLSLITSLIADSETKVVLLAHPSFYKALEVFSIDESKVHIITTENA